ncbi:hypothetical protein [Streptomyces sp. NPDC058086]|uniref:hypothetical protein n=1 Tax=Streptomyces sp. NPDC058086 TaxID=3346334 RepID=UPI0036E8E93E
MSLPSCSCSYDDSAPDRGMMGVMGDILTALITLYNDSAEKLSSGLGESVDAID